MSTPTAPLSPDQLRGRCDADSFDFATTAELEDIEATIGQERALEALSFGAGMTSRGYNLFVLGPLATDKHGVVRQFLERQAATRPRPDDWCYANNFADPQKPRALRLPAGLGAKLCRDMEELVEELRVAIPAAFESEEYRNRRGEIDQDLQERQNRSLMELRRKAEERSMGLLPTPQGFAIAPMRAGKVLSGEDFERLDADEKQRIEGVVAELMADLRQRLEEFPRWVRESRRRARELDREITSSAIGPLLRELEQEYAALPEVLAYLEEVKQDLVRNVRDFERSEETPENLVGRLRGAPQPSPTRYEVNLLVGHGDGEGAPVVYEPHPNLGNLIGRIEHVASFGALVTDFTLIRAGAMHQANGGFLMVDVDRMLTQPYAWQALKRTLFGGQICIESLDRALSLASTVSLEPQPIPLDVKVVLIGSRLLYYLLSAYDDDFAELFKVAADFEDRIDRSPDNVRLYAQLIATLARREQLRHLDREGVARVVEHLGRLVSDREKLSTHLRAVADLLRDADYWARQNGRDTVGAEDVEQAITSKIRRLDRMHQQVLEEIGRGSLLIDTDGAAVGQINGLSVTQLGEVAFGHPTRITATARLGKGEVIDIEREVDLGGAIHSKGVLILSSFIGSRYASNLPLSLAASLVFEQTYGGVEGDSASVAEACALLSVLAGVPIKQSLAVTGSVNQHGRVQVIGGVNQKIEGFFDVCRARGLGGEHGVLIPADNVKHLMLRRDVIEACEQGRFRVYPIRTVDEALTLLTGVEAGEMRDDGTFPEGTVNRSVADRLLELALLQREFSSNDDRPGRLPQETS